MTQIVGFLGRKQSGKDTSCKFLIMLKLLENAVAKKARINDSGEIEVTDIFGESADGQEWMEFKKPLVNTDEVLSSMKAIKNYSFAKPLKKDICINLLGLSKEQCYGTDEEKNSKTHLLWENMPFKSRKKGAMTGREVMQHIGTDIFRKMYPDIWLDALLKEIEKDEYKIAVLSDVRFDNEITKIQEQGGIIIGLTRSKTDSKDEHSSEQPNFDLCDHVIDNQDLTIPEQNKAIYFALKDLNCKHLTDLGV